MNVEQTDPQKELAYRAGKAAYETFTAGYDTWRWDDAPPEIKVKWIGVATAVAAVLGEPGKARIDAMLAQINNYRVPASTVVGHREQMNAIRDAGKVKP